MEKRTRSNRFEENAVVFYENDLRDIPTQSTIIWNCKGYRHWTKKSHARSKVISQYHLSVCSGCNWSALRKHNEATDRSIKLWRRPYTHFGIHKSWPYCETDSSCTSIPCNRCPIILSSSAQAPIDSSLWTYHQCLKAIWKGRSVPRRGLNGLFGLSRQTSKVILCVSLCNNVINWQSFFI